MRLARFLAERPAPPLPAELDDPSPEERVAALEAQRAIEKASGRLPTDPNLQPMPFFSWESAKDIFTMGGRFTLIRYDDEGNPNVGAAFWAMFGTAIGMITLVLLFARAVLNGEL
jgi:hypothetical protein